MNTSDKPSISAGIHDVVANFTDVVRNEGRLAKAEAGAAIHDVKAGIELLAVALAVGIPAITLTGAAAVDLIIEQTQLTRSSAGAIVGFLLALACVVLLMIARRAMASDHIAMRETQANFAKDVKAVKDTL